MGFQELGHIICEEIVEYGTGEFGIVKQVGKVLEVELSYVEAVWIGSSPEARLYNGFP